MKGFELPLHEIGLMEFYREYRSYDGKYWISVGECYEDYKEFCEKNQCGCVQIMTFLERMVQLGSVRAIDDHQDVYLLFPMLTYWEAREESYFATKKAGD